MTGFRHKRTRDELLEILKRQIGHLRASAAAYDSGTFAEAERLATVVYTLVHDGTGRTVSLLTQLEMRKNLQLLDSATRIDIPAGAEGFFAPPLCSIRLSSESVGVSPHCHRVSVPDPSWPTVPMSKWWEGEVFKTVTGLTLSRKNVVFALRAQDGGAHVDGVLKNEAYHWMRVDINPRLTASFGGVSKQLGDAHWATMRQIAWELDQALQQVGF